MNNSRVEHGPGAKRGSVAGIHSQRSGGVIGAEPLFKSNSQELLELSGADIAKCMKCGRCSAACPAGSEMNMRPHQFVSRMLAGDTEALLESEAIWQCLSCFCCVERCPRDVKPAKLLEAARTMLLRKQNSEAVSPDEIPALLGDEMPQQLLVSAFRKYRK